MYVLAYIARCEQFHWVSHRVRRRPLGQRSRLQPKLTTRLCGFPCVVTNADGRAGGWVVKFPIAQAGVWRVERRLSGYLSGSRQLAARSHLLGDPCFDGEFQIVGDGGIARSAMNHRVRRSIHLLFGQGVRCIQGLPSGLSIWLGPETLTATHSVILSALKDLLQQLAEGPPILDRLLKVAVEDPEVRVRVGATECLLRWLRRSRRPDLIGRYCSVLACSSSVRQRLRLDAVWVLWSVGTTHAAPQLMRVVGVEDREVAWLAVTLLAKAAHPAAASVFVFLSGHPDMAIAREAIAALGAMVDAPIESALRRIMVVDARLEIRSAAAVALGCVGRQTETATLLRQCLNFDTPRSLRRVAREALQRVEARLPGPGALSHATTTQEGQLSLSSEKTSSPKVLPPCPDENMSLCSKIWGGRRVLVGSRSSKQLVWSF